MLPWVLLDELRNNGTEQHSGHSSIYCRHLTPPHPRLHLPSTFTFVLTTIARGSLLTHIAGVEATQRAATNTSGTSPTSGVDAKCRACSLSKRATMAFLRHCRRLPSLVSLARHRLDEQVRVARLRGVSRVLWCVRCACVPSRALEGNGCVRMFFHRQTCRHR